MIYLNIFPILNPDGCMKGVSPVRFFTLKASELDQLIHEAREHKSIVNTDKPKNLFEMNGEIKKTRFLASFLKRGRKFKFNIIATSTLGSAYQFLKKGSKLRMRRALRRRYPTSLHIISKNDEEEQRVQACTFPTPTRRVGGYMQKKIFHVTH